VLQFSCPLLTLLRYGLGRYSCLSFDIDFVYSTLKDYSFFFDFLIFFKFFIFHFFFVVR
jgi:hypothetical protein